MKDINSVLFKYPESYVGWTRKVWTRADKLLNSLNSHVFDWGTAARLREEQSRIYVRNSHVFTWGTVTCLREERRRIYVRNSHVFTWGTVTYLREEQSRVYVRKGDYLREEQLRVYVRKGDVFTWGTATYLHEEQSRVYVRKGDVFTWGTVTYLREKQSRIYVRKDDVFTWGTVTCLREDIWHIIVKQRVAQQDVSQLVPYFQSSFNWPSLLVLYQQSVTLRFSPVAALLQCRQLAQCSQPPAPRSSGRSSFVQRNVNKTQADGNVSSPISFFTQNNKFVL